MIKTFIKLFYNKILSICYDTQRNSQDDIIIDLNKYDNINIDYKIQKKIHLYNGDFLENNLLNYNNKYNSLDNNTFIKENDCYNTNLDNEDIFENNLSNIHDENSYDDCKSKDDNSDNSYIDDLYDKISDID